MRLDERSGVTGCLDTRSRARGGGVGRTAGANVRIRSLNTRTPAVSGRLSANSPRQPAAGLAHKVHPYTCEHRPAREMWQALSAAGPGLPGLPDSAATADAAPALAAASDHRRHVLGRRPALAPVADDDRQRRQLAMRSTLSSISLLVQLVQQTGVGGPAGGAPSPGRAGRRASLGGRMSGALRRRGLLIGCGFPPRRAAAAYQTYQTASG